MLSQGSRVMRGRKSPLPEVHHQGEGWFSLRTVNYYDYSQLKMHKYDLKASDFQWPHNLIWASEAPFDAQCDAALILKSCVLYWPDTTPRKDRVFHKTCRNQQWEIPPPCTVGQGAWLCPSTQDVLFKGANRAVGLPVSWVVNLDCQS